MSINIIGDIAGNFYTLKALLDKMPEGEYISVGDMIDRGPNSFQVVDYTMKNGRAIYANHEDLMVDWYFDTDKYDRDVWFYNGGVATVKSFLKAAKVDALTDKGRIKPEFDEECIKSAISQKHIHWMKNLPRFIEHEDEFGKVLITHAPVNPVLGLEKACIRVDDLYGGDPDSIIWNRGKTKPIKGVNLQVFGHNSGASARWYGSPPHAVCIDTSAYGKLTGINWPTMEVFEQDIID